jgi:hypothetical protein
MTPPLIFLLDLDGTMQGDVRPQLQEYDLIRYINRMIVHGKKLRYRLKNLYNDMDKGLLRPGLKDALLHIKKAHPHVEFFVYTASTSDWAHFVISKIERHCFGQTFFHRPLFTRNHCDMSDGTKSIARVFPMVKQALDKKYPGKIYKENVFLIDNNPVLKPHEMQHLILCPSYDYVHVVDPLREVPKNVINDFILEIAYHITSRTSRNKQLAIRTLYDDIKTQMKNSVEVNQFHRNDRFFFIMADIISKRRIRRGEELNATIRDLRNIRLKV